MNITPKVILSNFRSFPISPVRESRFSLFFVHRTPTKASFSRFPFIVPRIWTDFLENRQFTIVSEQIFPKTDDLLSYLNEFPEKRRKDHLSTQKRVLKWSFLIGLF